MAELADAPEFRAFLEAEFPSAADPGGMTRRRWLQLMGASLALASAAGGCRWPKADLVPAVKRSIHRVPGEPQRFATAMDLDAAAVGLLVTSVDGRPIKIEGNPAHPQSLGATGAIAQASILQLYDPDRSGHLLQRTDQGVVIQGWQQFAAFARSHFADLSKTDGERLAVLAGSSSSPTLAATRSRLLAAFPDARWYEYEPLSRDNPRSGAVLAFGKPYRTHFNLRGAKILVTLDEDLLGSHPASVQYARAFADGREVADGKMNRLYAVESCYSVTGAAADHRLPLRSKDIGAIAVALERAVVEEGGGRTQLKNLPPSPPAPLPQAGEGSKRTPSVPALSRLQERVARNEPGEGGQNHLAPSQFATPSPPAREAPADEVERYVRAMAKDLAAHRGQSAVAVGPQQPPEVHAAVHRINAALGNVGKTVVYFAGPDAQRPTHREAIRSLVAEMMAGRVQTLLILGANPVYNAPVDLGFEEALAKVQTTIHLGSYADETARRCRWHLPEAHYLESWGDARSWDGTYSVVQPLVEPLLDGKSAIEVLSLVLGDDAASAEELVQATFRKIAGEKEIEAHWRQTLHDGVLKDSAWRVEQPVANVGGMSGNRLPSPPAPLPRAGEGSELEIVFCRSASVADGRYANNGWLQEMPDPITRLTWDNAALVSPETAAALGVENETLVRLKYRGRELLMPAYVLPGQATGCVAVALGYGRTAAGTVGGDEAQGIAPIGASAYRLRTIGALEFDSGLTVQPTGKKYPLATTQDHHAIDLVGLKARNERLGELIREATLEHYQEHPDFARHTGEHPPLVSLWQERSFQGHRWGMSIDLSKCIGCGACVVACQAENNVPIVGKQRVLQGREMHWIRVDRYFSGETERPRVDHQVVLCQQCENAPCEQVCPVAATVHNREGLNDMVYNRCIGTRYCSNNCPYKVRRFNFFNYRKNLDNPENELLKMVNNPQVTVRSRGVMEKCTYCVQRIQNARIDAKSQRRAIADGEIRTACQQVCPTRAIVFGDLSDPASEVARLQASSRAYGLLVELNIQPRTRYLAKIRNCSAELEDA